MDKEKFLAIVSQSLAEGYFLKLTLSKYVGEDPTLQNVYFRAIKIKNELCWSVVFRHKTKDITQNLSLNEGNIWLTQHLGIVFMHGDLFTTSADYTLLFNKKKEAKILKKKATNSSQASYEHDRQKHRTFLPTSTAYLNALGIANQQGEIMKEGQKKFRQIDKYIEIIDATLRQNPLPPDAHIVDMGAGKGYLTFALYDFLRHQQQLNISLTGIELRENLVVFCNNLAQQCQFKHLTFLAKDIFAYQPEKIDMLIALHACDIATDIAIAKGIVAEAKIIVVAPCCHKQVRKAMNTQSAMKAITKFGIMEERQAELLTDGIRALLLESRGYQVKALEFVSVEHTPKNLMLIAVKKNINDQALAQVEAIKAHFGIQSHYLEELLNQ
jgi:hypothetical protein